MLVKEDLEGFSENILPMFHVRKESGLSHFQEEIIKYLLSVIAKSEEKSIKVGSLAQLFVDVVNGQIVDYLEELISDGKIVATLKDEVLSF